MDHHSRKPLLVVSTGAGISAESGLATFRDSGGLWENYNVMDVASHEGYLRNPALIHNFYNTRRREASLAMPNNAHLALKRLEDHFDVRIITQNVDNLHERAGSANVVHLHGRLDAVEATDRPDLVWTLPADLQETSVDTIIEGHHVRPHIVFFGEAVPEFERAAELAERADIFVIIGTSLQVYPAAALLRYVRPGVPVYYIDPHPAGVPANVHVIAKPASEGMKELSRLLTDKLNKL